MNFVKNQMMRLGSGERMNAYCKKTGETELYYFSGEWVGKKVVDKTFSQIASQKNVKLNCKEYLPLGQIGIAVADNIYTLKKEKD